MRVSDFNHGHGLSEQEVAKRLKEFSTFANQVRATGRVTVTQMHPWHYRFEYGDQRFDLMPLSRKVVDVANLTWYDGKWATYRGMLEKIVKQNKAALHSSD
jgi:hypothetical protein